MARIHIPYPMTGSVGGLVFYHRKDSKDKTFVRMRSEPAAGRPPSRADDTRGRNAHEMKGRAAAAVALRRLLHPLEPVRRGNWQSGLAGALKPLQTADTEGVFGQRAIRFSRRGALLAGYSLSRQAPLEALVRSPLEHHLDREAHTATVVLPALAAGVNLAVPGPQPWMRWVAVLGALPDMEYLPGAGYTPAGDYRAVFPQVGYGEWCPVKGGAPATTLQLSLPTPAPTPAFGLVLAAGLLLGTVDSVGAVTPVSYAGAGKILAVG